MKITKNTKLFTRLLVGILFAMVILVGCTDKGETEDVVGTPKDKKTEEVEEVDSESDPLKEDMTFGGKVLIEDDRIRVLGESNLVEGTVVTGKLYSSPFTEVRDSFNTGEEVSIDENGNFEMEFLYEKYSKKDFLEQYTGSILEVELEVEMGYSQPEEITDLYGFSGENLQGPIVYKKFSFGEVRQFLYMPIYVRIGDNQTEYEIEAPERSPMPEDYGEPKVWIEIDESGITHDHEFFYVKGKSNLIEGTFLSGGYYSSEIGLLPQSFFYNTAYVQPDGSFVFRADYHTLAEEGFIRIRIKPFGSHRASNLLDDAYGKKFERMEGEYVTYNELDEKNEIEIILYPSIPQIEVPEETKVTEDDGEIKVQVPNDVLFDFDKNDVKADAKKTLDEIITMLEALEAGTKIQINGHTDSEGEADYNVTLSENRALAVETYLMNNGNLDHLDITTTGFGETKPIASNETGEGKERNRRVEIVINAK